MTAHPDHPSAPTARMRRPRWLLPVLVAAVLAIALVIGGILPASVVVYAFSMGGHAADARRWSRRARVRPRGSQRGDGAGRPNGGCG